ncbi:MAG: TonB-dependent receptor plug domain-containing protein, partial [Candidatus Acidiferrales bacterium]
MAQSQIFFTARSIGSHGQRPVWPQLHSAEYREDGGLYSWKREKETTMKGRHYHFILLPLFCVLMILCLAGRGMAQAKSGVIAGQAADVGGGILRGASVKVEPGNFSTVSDSQGQFSITNLPAGSYTVTISYAGFSPFSQTVNLSAGQSVSVNAVLELAPANAQVEVQGVLQGEAEETQVQKTSDDIVNVIAADVITSLPNANIADAVGRLPGVTLERDEGEGKYVQIRGTEPRLTNVTIDGINVPSPEVAVRQVKLDVIPADLVESIVVEKTLSANQDGDAIGGTVDLKLKNAEDQPTLIVTGIGGYTPILGGRYVGQSSATVGQRFGTNKRFGVLLGFTYDY